MCPCYPAAVFAVWIFGLGLVFSACSNASRDLPEWTPADHGQPAPERPEVDRGSAAVEKPEPNASSLWLTHCAVCHGAEGRGDGPSRPAGAAQPDFTRADWQSGRSNEELALAIARGRGAMPAFAPMLPPEEIAALVFFVRGLGAP